MGDMDQTDRDLSSPEIICSRDMRPPAGLHGWGFGGHMPSLNHISEVNYLYELIINLAVV